MFSKLLVLARIAFANIFSSLLNLFVGLVLLLGSALLVVGGSLFSTLDGALSKSIVSSVTGHLQLYGARSKDPLEIYGKVDGSDSNLAPLDDFPALKRRLLAVPNVDRVLPMGTATAMVIGGNTIDVTLERLRGLHRAQADAATALPKEEFERRCASAEDHVRQMVAVLQTDVERAREMAANTEEERLAREALGRAASEEFWTAYRAEPLPQLEFLENRVAPLVADGDMLFIRALGTDLDAYQATFDRMAIVEGGPVPRGHRGVLVPRFFREELLKLKNARRLDKIKDAREAGRRLGDASDKELQRYVKENQAQTREIVLQLDGLATRAAVERLQAHLGSPEKDLSALLSSFFGVTDENFDARYRFFYEQLAPLLTLYRVKVGDTLTLRSIGRAGSVETTQVKVYGVFELRGLEKSPLAGTNALVDMMTFRDLYGFLTAERRAETEALKAATGAKEISRESAEAELFGGADDAVAQVQATAIEEPQHTAARVERKSDTFAPEEIDEGVVLHAAVLLQDGSELAQARTRDAIEAVLASDVPPPDAKAVAAAKALAEASRTPFALAAALRPVVAEEEARLQGGGHLPTDELLALQAALKAERASMEDADVAVVDRLMASARPKVWAVSWSFAAGFLGKFIAFFRLLLAAVVVAFAFIALIVVTIGMTIATLQRTSTIGTLRAIGAQRSFVVGMVLVETLVLALTFGVAGALVGSGIVQYLHATGIPAFRDELYFFFSGPVLRPELTVAGVALSLAVTLVVSVLAVLFPLYLATRVAPITAMQASE